jgi:hypothetical protein
MGGPPKMSALLGSARRPPPLLILAPQVSIFCYQIRRRRGRCFGNGRGARLVTWPPSRIAHRLSTVWFSGSSVTLLTTDRW